MTWTAPNIDGTGDGSVTLSDGVNQPAAPLAPTVDSVGDGQVTLTASAAAPGESSGAITIAGVTVSGTAVREITSSGAVTIAAVQVQGPQLDEEETSGGGNHYSFDYEPILSEREYKALADAYMRTGRDDHPDRVRKPETFTPVDPPKVNRTTTSSRAITAGLTSAQQSVEALRRDIEYAKVSQARQAQADRQRVEAERLQAQQRIKAEEAARLRRKREDEAAILLLLAS